MTRVQVSYVQSTVVVRVKDHGVPLSFSDVAYLRVIVRTSSLSWQGRRQRSPHLHQQQQQQHPAGPTVRAVAAVIGVVVACCAVVLIVLVLLLVVVVVVRRRRVTTADVKTPHYHRTYQSYVETPVTN